MTEAEYDTIRPGFYLMNNGKERLVLATSKGGLSLLILNCSWTDRPYTVILRREIISATIIKGKRITEFHGRLKLAYLEANERPPSRKRHIRCSTWRRDIQR